MKKSLIILALALLQCACATREPVPAAAASLVSFDAIAAEIIVTHEPSEAVPVVSLNHD